MSLISGSITFDVESLAEALAARLAHLAEAPRLDTPEAIRLVAGLIPDPGTSPTRAEISAVLVTSLAEQGYALVKLPPTLSASTGASQKAREDAWFNPARTD